MRRATLESAKEFCGAVGKIRLPPVRYAIVCFAFSGWPFIWRENRYLRLGSLLVLLIMAVVLFASRERVRGNVALFALVPYTVILLVATIAAKHASIRAAWPTRTVVYVLLLGGALAMSSVGFEELRRAVRGIIWLYLIISLPSVIILVSFLTGIELPYRNVDLSGRGSIYRLYPFGVVSEETILNLFDWTLVRVNGFSEEPGVLGTYVVFFLIMNRYVGSGRSKRVVEVILHLLGIVSFSLFYYMAALTLLLAEVLEGMLKLTRGGRVHVPTWSTVAKVLCTIGVGAAIITYIVPGNPVYYLTVARIYAEDQGVLGGDSRRQYNERIVQYIAHADWGRLLIGNGPGSNSLDEDIRFASWASELYDTGILSMGIVWSMYLYLLGRHTYSRERVRVKAMMTLVPAIASFYQRPEMISPIMIIFWIVMARLVDRGERLSQVELRIWPARRPELAGQNVAR